MCNFTVVYFCIVVLVPFGMYFLKCNETKKMLNDNTQLFNLYKCCFTFIEMKILPPKSIKIKLAKGYAYYMIIIIN